MIRAVLLSLLLALQPVAAGNQAENTPGFTLKDLTGRTVRLSDYRGKVTLLNFWATWCPPCRAEMPELIELQKRYQDRGLQIIGITYPPYRRSRVRGVMKSLGVHYPVLLGTRKVAALYSVGEVLPVTIVIDRQGKLRDRILGILTPEEFEEKVAPLLQ